MKRLYSILLAGIFSTALLQAQDPNCYVNKSNLHGLSYGGFTTSIHSVVCNAGSNSYTITLRVEHDGCKGGLCKELSHYSVEANAGTYSNVTVSVISGSMTYTNIDMGPNLGGGLFDGFKIDNTGNIGNGDAGVFHITYTLSGNLQSQSVLAKTSNKNFIANFTVSEFQSVMYCNNSSCAVNPTAVNDTATTSYNSPVLIHILNNDNGNSSSLDNSSLSFISGTTPDPSTEGTFTDNGNGSITFTPVNGFTGTASVTYEICNTEGLCATADVFVTIDASSVDADGDGVLDGLDDYPNDATRAFNVYYPAAGVGTLAYEDLWPSKGDFDMNDLVMNYRFKTVTNSSNQVVEVIGTFSIRSFGASYRNGFGFQLPNSNVSGADLSVSGYVLSDNYINLGANGLEQGQNHPTVIVYDNTFNLMPHPGTGIGVNTDPAGPYVNPVTVTITMSFSGSYTAQQVGIENFNPFIIINRERGREVHLPNYAPTALVDNSYFGQLDDASITGSGVTYVTDNNLPWALNIPAEFSWPREKVDIINVYTKFEAWAESGGSLYPDWYSSQSGYVNTNMIYQVP